MITGNNRKQFETIWNAYWNGGVFVQSAWNLQKHKINPITERCDLRHED